MKVKSTQNCIYNTFQNNTSIHKINKRKNMS